MLLLSSTPSRSEVAFESPDWYIVLSDFGYSDFLIYTSGNFPSGSLHEMLSGEWGAGIGYDGIESRLPPPQRTMWLEPNWVYPSWTTNSQFTVVTPFVSPPVDTDGDGLPEGFSVITNGDVQVTIRVDMQDTLSGTPMGVRSTSPVISNRYVMVTTYEIQNVSGHALTGVRFYQFMHAHPANDEVNTVRAFYDPNLYAGAQSAYRYDVTQTAINSGDVTGEPTGCLYEDHVNFGGEVAPTAFGLGSYRDHLPSKPPVGLHYNVENDTLANETTFGPDQVAGAERWGLGTLNNGQTVIVRVLLAVKSVEQTGAGSVQSDTCARITNGVGDLRLGLTKGNCTAGVAAGPYDVISGRLQDVVGGLGTVFLGAVTCHANDMLTDRVTVTHTMSLCRDSFFVLARRGGSTEFDYGSSSAGEPRIPSFGDCP
jgi:hypothetical protein